MNNSKFSLFLAGILAIVLLIGSVAALNLSRNSDFEGDFRNIGDSEQLIISGDEFFDITNLNDILNFELSTGNNNFNIINTTPVSNVSSAGFNITLSSIPTGFPIGNNQKNLVVSAENSTNSSLTDSIQIPVSYTKTFCDNGEQNETSLVLSVDIENNGEGEDEDWKPLDTIEMDVELDNRGNHDLDDVVFELGFFRKGSTSNDAEDLIWLSEDDEQFEFGDIDEDEDGSHTFELRVDPELADGDYVLVVKAYPDGEESEVCIDHSTNLDDFGTENFFADISISKETDKEKMVVVDTNSINSPLEAQCGELVSFSADVWNIGDEDFEDQIKVRLYNNELNLDEEVIIPGDFDEGDNVEADFSFTVPQDAEEGTYRLAMNTYYDYDKDDETYDEISEDAFYTFLDVSGNCAGDATADTTSLSAALESGGKPGENLVVRTTISNTGDFTSNYTVNAAQFTEWAESAEVSPKSVSVPAGSSRDVSITLAVKDDVSGEQSFNVEILSGNNLVLTQPVAVIIESPSFFSSITGKAINEDNWYLWGIGAINVILVLAIIFVVVRLLRRKE